MCILPIISYITVKQEHFVDKNISMTYVCRIRPYAYAVVRKAVQTTKGAKLADSIWRRFEKVTDIRKICGTLIVLVA